MKPLTLILFVFLMLGCAHSNQKEVSLEKSVPGTNESVSRISVLLRDVLRQPTLQGQNVGDARETDLKIQIPTPQLLAADGTQYTLAVDSDQNIAWVIKQGGIGNHLGDVLGPWHADDPGISELKAAIVEYQESQDVAKNKVPESAQERDAESE